MRIAILGCGSIGRRHARNLRGLGNSDLLAFDPDAAALETLRQETEARCFGRLEEVWEAQPHVALITAPPDRHIELALAAAEQGCDLFIEKPLSCSREGVDDLCREVSARGSVAMVGCNMRFDPGPARVQRLLQDGAAGEVLAARLETGSYLPSWRPGTDYRTSYSASAVRGGGAILDCIHEIDLALWYLGPGAVVGAAAIPASSIGLDVEGLAEILIRHDTGALSSVHLSFVERGYRRGCRLVGTEGTISWDFEDGRVIWRGPDGQPRARYERPEDWSVNFMYVEEMRHFLECVADRRAPSGSLEEGRRALDLALCARQICR